MRHLFISLSGSEFRVRGSEFRAQISDFRFQISDLRFQISDLRFPDLRGSAFRFQINVESQVPQVRKDSGNLNSEL